MRERECLKACACLLAALCLGVGIPALHAQDANPAAKGSALEGIEIRADDYQYQPDTGRAVGKGHVTLSYKDTVITADQVEADVNAKSVVATGHVVLKRGIFTWEGDEVKGNLETKQFSVGTFKARSGELYGTGKSGSHDGKTGQTLLKDLNFSTCSYVDDPHYSVHASRMTHYADGSFTARNAIIKVGSVPIFWLPYMWGQAGKAGGVEIKPGYSSRWGAYLLFAKTWRINQYVDTKMRVDVRTKNGLALGNETRIITDATYTNLMVYGMHDENPPETEPGYNRRFETEDNRYRARGYHRSTFLDDQNLNLRLRVDKFSDIDMLEDWFRKEYHNDPQPKSFADVTLDSDRFSLALSARARLNDFYTEADELPKLKLDMPRQRLGNTGFYYQGETSIADMHMNWRDFDKDRLHPITNLPLQDPEDYDAVRFDTVQMFYHPLQLADLVALVPRAGARLTWYSKSSKDKITTDDLENMALADDPDNDDFPVDVKNYDDDGDSLLRLAGELGFEVTSKFYRTWAKYENRRWDIDGLRHVVQPYLNYTYVTDPTEEREHLYFFDEIDRMIEQNFVRLGLKQRWETRRSNRIYTLASLENYADFHFHAEDDFEHPGDFGTKFTFNPKRTLEFWGNMLVDMGDAQVTRFSLGTGIGDRKICRVDVGYLYRNDYTSRTVYSMGSTLTDIAGDAAIAHHYTESHYATVQFTFPMWWQMDALVRYEYDLFEHRLARQAYEVQRDLHCWRGALRFEEDDGDFAIMLMLYLKAYPGFHIDTSL